ncbi:MAG: UvrD-helicase domain-containing protein, partial [Bacteroidetes bacterium]|nr:UvrD-helicase domain-containing protein [Bacteroidota bacterium]
LNKWNQIRRQLVSAHISTIHSFCVDVLRQFPVESKIDANFTPIDQITSNELIELAIDEEIKKIFHDADKNSEIKKVIRILGSKNSLSEVITNLIYERRKISVIQDYIYKNNIDGTVNNYTKIYAGYLEKIFSDDLSIVVTKIKLLNDDVLINKKDNKYGLEIKNLLSKIKGQNKLKENLIILKKIGDHLLTNKNLIRKQGYLKNDSYLQHSDERNIIEEFYERLAKLNLEINEEVVNKKLAEFSIKLLNIFQLCLENYEKRKTELGYLDYEDILLFTKNIISDPSVISELKKKFKYIMIDEYQDTNELQYNIFLPILDYLKNGNLFIVGDEKQSIYSFRDADLNIFTKTKNDIKELEGNDSLLSLPDSFRMSPVISAFTNYVFRNLFSNPNPLYNEVTYSELVCARNDSINGEIEILSAENNDEQDENITESELVAKRILKLVNEDKWKTIVQNEEKNIQWQDISILCRRRKYFKELEIAFVKYGIPFTIVGGQGFYQRQPIYDVYNYFSFLLDNKNDTALIGIMRSPFFNLSDSILFEVSLEIGEGFWKKLKKYSLNNNGLNHLIKTLEENINLASSSEVSFVLRKIFKESPFISTLASRINGKQEIANLQKLISITNNYSQKPFKTLYDYVEYLKNSIEKISDEAQSILTLDSSAVNIMTLHQAKGLEFPAVFLYKCGEQNKSRNKKVIIDKEFGILSKLPVDDGYYEDFIEPPLLSISNIINSKKDEAELKRLLYVGITRAKDYLFISSTKEKKYGNRSFLGLLSSALEFNDESDSINISTKFQRLVTDEKSFKNIIENIDINIPIIKKVGLLPVKPIEIIDVLDKKNIIINIDQIIDHPSGEIISATKIAVYSQCPLKYKFTYDLGLTKLYENYKNYDKSKSTENEYEFNPSEIEQDEDLKEKNNLPLGNYPPELKGKLIHNILQKEIKYDELDNYLNSVLNEKNFQLILNDKIKNSLKEDIKNDLRGFYEAPIFSEINSHKNYTNEFELYLKENDYYLYGIIDKIIFEDNKITIVDYKTDNIQKEQIKDRIENYLPQLNFYAYLIIQLYDRIEQIDIKLIFIKHPLDVYSKSIKKEELTEFGGYLKEAVNNMRINNYKKNLKHCSKCLFTDSNGNCIKK